MALATQETRGYEKHRKQLAQELAQAEEQELSIKRNTPIDTAALRRAVAIREKAYCRYERWVMSVGSR